MKIMITLFAIMIILTACTTIEIINNNKTSLPVQMSYVEAGDFDMGSFKGFVEERPVHTVSLTRNFFISKYETTNKQLSGVLNWGFKNKKIAVGKDGVKNTRGQRQVLIDVFDDDSGINFNGINFTVKIGMDDYPCVKISWYGAVVFCNLLSEMENKTPCYNLNDWSCNFNVNGYRLPTEAEWEFACIGGKKSGKYKYAGSDDPYSVAWINNNSEGQIHKVGLKMPNELELYDMSGNVWEWCYDYFNRMFYYFSPQLDPKGPTHGLNRAIRGGAFVFNAFTSRCTARFLNSDPAGMGRFGGFRVVQTADFEVASKSLK